MASGVRRGSDGKAAFEVHKDRHATNVEVLTDVAVLSSADALVHGASAVSEAALARLAAPVETTLWFRKCVRGLLISGTCGPGSRGGVPRILEFPHGRSGDYDAAGGGRAAGVDAESDGLARLRARGRRRRWAGILRLPSGAALCKVMTRAKGY